MTEIYEIMEIYESLEGYHTVGQGSIVKLYHNNDFVNAFANTRDAMLYAIKHDGEKASLKMWKQASIAITAIQEISRAHYNPRAGQEISKKEAREILRHIERVLKNAKKNAQVRMVHVDDTNLSIGAKNSLRNFRKDFVYLDNVYDYFLSNGECGLLKIKAFGRRSLNETIQSFKEHFNHSH